MSNFEIFADLGKSHKHGGGHVFGFADNGEMHGSKKFHVLIVEDDAVMRENLVLQIQQQAGLTLVGAAGYAQEALAVLAKVQVDYAFIDIGLPDLSGIELIRRIGQSHPDCDCLVISVFGDEESVIQALCAGAAGYLLKEPQMLNLADALSCLRAGGSPISPLIARKVLHQVRLLALADSSSGTPNTTSAALRAPDAPAPEDARLLSKREQELLLLISRGYKYEEAAALMRISLSTVQSYIKAIYRKLAVRSKTEAVFEARSRNLLDS
jgi:DNA-binding NarL/FixJ family response regulator